MNAIETRQLIKAQLAAINPANGYQSTVAEVRTGRAALVVGPDDPLPAITLTTTRDDPVSPSVVQQGFQEWTRTIELEAIVDTAGDWDDTLDVLFDDIRRALSMLTGAALQIGSVNFISPEDGAGATVLQIPITYQYFIRIAE